MASNAVGGVCVFGLKVERKKRIRCAKKDEGVSSEEKRLSLNGLGTDVVPEATVATGVVIDTDNVASHRLKTPESHSLQLAVPLPLVCHKIGPCLSDLCRQVIHQVRVIDRP